MFYNPFSPFYLAQLSRKFTPRYVSPLSVSHMDTLSYVHGSRVRSYVVQIGAKTQADARVALSGAFMLTCNKTQNWFTKITGVYRSLPRWSSHVRLLYGYTTLTQWNAKRCWLSDCAECNVGIMDVHYTGLCSHNGMENVNDSLIVK